MFRHLKLASVGDGGRGDQGGVNMMKADIFGMLTDINLFILARNTLHSQHRAALLQVIKTQEKPRSVEFRHRVLVDAAPSLFFVFPLREKNGLILIQVLPHFLLRKMLNLPKLQFP